MSDPADERYRRAFRETATPALLTDENFDLLDELHAVADEVGGSPAQTAIAWLQHHDRVSVPLLGARTVEQLEENLGAAAVDLSQEQFERLADAKEQPLGNL